MKRLLPMALVLCAVVGCGGEPGEPKVRQQLADRVAELKTAALAHNRVAAESALASLHGEVVAAVSSGTLDSESAGEIMIAADRVAEDLRTMPGPATPVTVTPPGD